MHWQGVSANILSLSGVAIFGRPLASYQALKHRSADMKIWFEACRAPPTPLSRRSRPLPGRGEGGQHRESLCGRTRPGDAAGLRPVARRHRRDVGARSAPVPAPGHARPRDVRHARGSPPARLRAHRGSEEPRDDRYDDSAPTEPPNPSRVRRAGPGLAGREHAAHRSRPIRRSDRGEEAPWLRARELQKRLLRRRLRRHLLPARIRRTGPGPSPISRRSTPSPAPTRCRSS